MPETASTSVQQSTFDRKSLLRLTCLALGALGLALRFVLAAISIGCDDADIWLQHAHTIDSFGMRYAFEHQPPGGAWQYNHPPPMGYWALLSARLTDFDPAGFSRLMKAPGLLAEIGTSLLLYRIWLRRKPALAAPAFAAYGLSLPLILVSGYHCNTEPLYAGLSLLAFYLIHERKQPFYAGLALAAALNVKLMPIFLIPPLFALCRTRRSALLAAAGLSLAIIPFVPFLITSAAGMYRNMLAYNSIQLDWGINAFLNHAAGTPPFAQFFAEIREFWIKTGRYWILASVLVTSGLAFMKKSRLGYELGALAWAFFLVLTPGFGVQYSVSVLPLLFAVDIKRGVLYSLGSGLMLFFIYTYRMQLELPLHAGVQYFPCPLPAVLFGILGWSVLLSFLVQTVPRLRVEPPIGIPYRADAVEGHAAT